MNKQTIFQKIRNEKQILLSDLAVRNLSVFSPLSIKMKQLTTLKHYTQQKPPAETEQ